MRKERGYPVFLGIVCLESYVIEIGSVSFLGGVGYVRVDSTLRKKTRTPRFVFSASPDRLELIHWDSFLVACLIVKLIHLLMFRSLYPEPLLFRYPTD